MIDKLILNQITTAAKIEVIIGDLITLKKRGANYKGICPFHKEQTESFSVSPEKGIFKCFGCGKTGDAIGFIQEYDGVSFPVAAKKVAKMVGIDVPERELTPEELNVFKLREQAITTLIKQQELFRGNLSKHDKALEWLTKEREITPYTIEKWELGYSSTGFFAGRITYPIRNVQGEICGHTGRRLKEELMPKFKNTPETDLFKKSELLFGLHHAKRFIRQEKKCYLVEGQHDVLQMDQLGFSNTVAPSGTAISVEQIRSIKLFTDNIVLFLDGDAPGLKAAVRNISAFLAEQINLRIIVLPEKEDPDSFIRNAGHEKARQFIERTEIDFIEFKTQMLRDEISADPSKKGELIDTITSDISIINDKNVRLVYIQQCSAILGVDENELRKDIRQLREKVKEKKEEGKWFAFDEAAEDIKDKNQVNILSTFDDVIENHMNKKKNFIGMNCSTLQKSEILKLKKLTRIVIYDENLTIAYDTETKDETPTIKNLKRLISFGFDVRMREEHRIKRKIGHEDEEDIFEEIDVVSYNNFTDWYIEKITGLISASDDRFTSFAVEHIAELLSYLPDSARMTKIGNVQSFFKNAGVKLIVGDFKKILANFLKKNAKTYEPSGEVEISPGDNPMNLDKEQLNDLNRYQHYFDKNAMYHISKTGHIAKISNFVITPIIHSNTSSGPFKLFEMVNEHDLKVNISLDTKDLNDLRRFKCAVEEKGNFIFKGQQNELDDIKERLYSHTTYSCEIEQLGWQSEGFWAWADGVTTTDGKFTETDENGLITVGGKNYLIKAFSNLYAHDKTAFLTEKKFKHLISETTFKDWSSRYFDVFGNNAMISICTLITSIYSDEIFKLVHGELPLLNLFGPKGTGKTQIADSLLAFFGEKQAINNLSKVTIYGLSQTLKSFHNSICLIDEYKNMLDMRFIEMLKSIYNRQAKIQGSFSQQGTKTEHIPINQMAILCGQDLPTLDVALLERCICLTAYKSDYTDEQLTRYGKLKTLEEKGLSHLTDDLIKHRDLVLKNFSGSNVLIQKQISERCPGVSVRLQKNLTTILTAFHVLQNEFDFPFTFEQVLDFGISTIEEQQKFIESSDDLKNFWSIFATLIEQKKIKEGRNYTLSDVCQMRYVGSDELITYPKGMMCLFIRWDGLYPMYAQYARMSNMPALGEKTIQFYLEKTKYYQGKIAAKRFADRDTKETWNHQAWCFDYNKMEVNLIESQSIESDNKDMRPNVVNPSVAKMVEEDKEAKKIKQEELDLKKAQEELPF